MLGAVLGVGNEAGGRVRQCNWSYGTYILTWEETGNTPKNKLMKVFCAKKK